MKLAGKRLCFGAAALLTMAGVAVAVPNLASAHTSGLRPTGDGGVGITSGPLCDDGSSNGSVTLFGSPGSTFTIDGVGSFPVVGGDESGPGFAEVTGLAAGKYRADPGNIKIDVPKCDDDNQNHPCSPRAQGDIKAGEATSVAGVVWIKSGSGGDNHGHYSFGYKDAGYIIPAQIDVGGKMKDTSHADVCGTPSNEVTPLPPTLNPPTCVAGGSLVIPAQPQGVSITPSVGTHDSPAVYEVVVTPLEGYDFPDGFDTHFDSPYDVLPATGYQNDDPQAPCYLTENILPPTLNVSYDCLSDEVTYTLTTELGEWTAGPDEDPSPLGVKITVTANPGFLFSPGQGSVVLTATAAEVNDCEVTAVEPTLHPTEECGVIDMYSIPSTKGVIYYAGQLVIPGGDNHQLPETQEVTITAKAADGYVLTNPDFSVTLVGGEVERCPEPGSSSDCAGQDWVVSNTGAGDLVLVFKGFPSLVVLEGESTTIPEGIDSVEVFYTDQTSDVVTRPEGCQPLETSTTTQPPVTTQPPATTPDALDISAIGPVCAKDVPYIEVTFGAQSQFNGRPASVTFRDLNGNVVGTDSATYQAGTTVRFVYPGASVDAAGNATDWPGWVFDGDEWVVDPSDANLRAGLTVVIEVNPTATATVSYPPATAACANPVQVDPAPTTTTATVPAGALPQTGSSTTVLASIAALLVLAGGGALMATRRSTAKG